MKRYGETVKGFLTGHGWGLVGFLGWFLLAGCVGSGDTRWRGIQATSSDPQLDRLQKAAQSDPSPRSACRLGQYYRQRGDWDRAAQSFRQALQKDPDHLESLLAMAELSLQMQLPEQAVGWIDHAAKAAPEDAWVQRRCGFLYEAAGQLRAAESAWRKTLALHSRDSDVQVALVNLLASQERWGEAEAVASQSGNANAHRLLGKVFLGKKRPPQALAQFQAAVRLDSHSALAHLDCADAEMACGNLERAQYHLRQAQKLAPDSAAPLVKLAMIHEKQQQPEKAIAAYLRALEEDPQQIIAANNLAYLYVSRGEKLEEALRLAQLAHRKSPEDPFPADTLGWVYHRQGQHQEALPLLEQAAKQLPQEPQVHYHLASVYRALGQTQEAQASARRALELSDHFPGAEECQQILQQPTPTPDAKQPQRVPKAPFSAPGKRQDLPLSRGL